jgi:hypothetical protein
MDVVIYFLPDLRIYEMETFNVDLLLYNHVKRAFFFRVFVWNHFKYIPQRSRPVSKIFLFAYITEVVYRFCRWEVNG